MAMLSVIVPIYNTRDYLKKCIESILNQTFKDMELILVDDGSTDGSAEVCQNYVLTDKRVKYIYQENAGAAIARKTGVFAAEGKFIGFVDSDDYIDEDFYEKMMEIALKYDVDLVESSFFKPETKRAYIRIKEGLYKTESQMNYIKDNFLCYNNTFKSGIEVSNNTKIFKRNLLKPVLEKYSKYNKRINCGEDRIITSMYILVCKSVYISNICGYKYVCRYSSVTHSADKNSLQNLADYYMILSSVFMEDVRSETLMNQLEIDVKNLLICIPRLMGFSINNQFKRYTYSIKYDSDSKIALYGAGIVGKDYYKSMVGENKLPVIWVDVNYLNMKEEFDVKPISELKNVEFDYVIIAVLYETVADEIKNNLINMGIPKEKILWEEPVFIEY